MDKREEIIQVLEKGRGAMIPLLEEIDKNRKVYPLWTVREVLAHISGWDDAIIAFVNSLFEGKTPAVPAARGINEYNAETVATREGLDYDHIYREYIETRRVLIDLIRKLKEEDITRTYILPWGEEGSMVDVVNIFGPHELEHAEDLHKMIEEQKGK